MTAKIFKSILCLTIAVLIATTAVIVGALFPYFTTLEETQLKDELTLAAAATESQGVDYLSGLKPKRFRLTWVDPTGTVLYDSHADPATMENHASRDEIREAMNSGSGASHRKSATLTEATLYEALRLSDGSVLRISTERATVFALLLGMLRPIVLMTVLAAVLAVVLANRMAKRVTEPLNALDLENPLSNDTYPELSPLLGRIHRQQLELESKRENLDRMRSEFERVTSGMQEVLLLLDDRGRVLSCNPAASALFGTEVLAGTDVLSLEHGKELRDALSAAHAEGHAECRLERGGRTWLFTLTRTVAEQGGGMVVLGMDVTDRVNAERDRREFTANVSHELKTPLQSIIGSAELIENGLVKQEDMPRFVGHIRFEAQRLLQLIRDIIELSGLDEGTELPTEETDLMTLAEEARETLADAAEKKRVRMSVSGAEGRLCGVRRLLYEIVYNLMDNAIRYNRPEGTVDVVVAEDEKQVTVRVADTGEGIPREHRDKVFERFYRVDKSHSKASGGTGLGLSIVKHAVQYHGGCVKMDSEPGKGTIVTVTLPKHREA